MRHRLQDSLRLRTFARGLGSNPRHGYQPRNAAAAAPNVPVTVNVDGTFDPWDFYHYGPAVDILESDNYYEVRLRNAYWYATNRVPVDDQAKLSYAVARSCTAAAEPKPFVHLLYSCKYKDTSTGNIWPFPFPASKHMEAYYSLAGGSKGMGYWWLADKPAYPSYGLTGSSECAPLWKEMGLIGNEIKTAQPLLVTSTPVDMTLTPSANVWAGALASGTDTIILLVVNDNYYNDSGLPLLRRRQRDGDRHAAIVDAASPAAFEITAGGLNDVSTVLNGNQLLVDLGTLDLTRMIVVTTNPQLRPTIQHRIPQDSNRTFATLPRSLHGQSAHFRAAAVKPDCGCGWDGQLHGRGFRRHSVQLPVALNTTNIAGATTSSYTRRMCNSPTPAATPLLSLTTRERDQHRRDAHGPCASVNH